MRKAGLLDRKPMIATAAMMHKAKSDRGVIKTVEGIYKNYRYDYTEYESRFYFRAALTANKEILEVDLFTRRCLAAGSKEPRFRIFLDYARKDFISWNMTEEKWSNAKIDMLETGDERYRYSYRGRNFTSKETLNIVNRYLQTGNMQDVEMAVLDFQAAIRKCSLAKKHKLVTDVIDGYMNTVPDKLPADWTKFINDKALASAHSIFYKADTGIGYCTHCRLYVPVPKNVKHNMQGKCNCGSRITYKSWKKQKSVQHQTVVTLVQKCTDGQRYVYRQFAVNMRAGAELGYIPEIMVHEDYRWLFCFAASKPLQDAGGAYEWGEFRSTGITRWCKAGTVKHSGFYSGSWHQMSVLYTANLKKILKGTCLQYIPISEIIKGINSRTINVVAVLGDMSMSFPYEAFWKMGLHKFVIERVERGGTNGITRTDWHLSNKPWQYLKITKDNLMQAARLDAGDRQMRIIQAMAELCINLTDEQAVWLDKYVGAHNVLRYFAYYTPHRMIRYMKEQLEIENDANKDRLSLWTDYIDTAHQLGWNLDDRSIFFPQNIQRAHDEAVIVFDIQKDKEDAEKMWLKDKIMNQNARQIKKAFCYRDNEFIIKVPGCYLDFKHEGHAQHNCVATYYERAVAGKCIILFIRQRQCPNKSYCTVEIRNRQGKFYIEQNRAAYNKPAPNAAVIFMEKAVAAAQKIADSMAAEEREQIRIQAAG